MKRGATCLFSGLLIMALVLNLMPFMNSEIFAEVPGDAAVEGGNSENGNNADRAKTDTDEFVAELLLTSHRMAAAKSHETGEAPDMPAVTTADRGSILQLNFLFSNPGMDENGKSHISYDVAVKKPDGSIHKEMGVVLESEELSVEGGKRSRLCKNPVAIEIGENDPWGDYLVQATIRDNISGNEVSRCETFRVNRFNMLPEYDFSYDYQAEKQKELASNLEPAGNISLEQYAHISAGIWSGEKLDTLLEKSGIEKTEWEEAETIWTERMRSDQTFTVGKEYGRHFFSSGFGNYPEAGRAVAEAYFSGGAITGKTPVPFEKWIQVTQALTIGSQKGRDTEKILGSFGYDAYDWAIVSNWWGIKISEDMQTLNESYAILTQKYQAQYEAQFETEE